MVSFSLPLKEPSQNQLQLLTLAGMLQAPGRVQLWQLGGMQGREEQLERQLKVGRQKLYGMVLEGVRCRTKDRQVLQASKLWVSLPLESIYTPPQRVWT
jgi:hypothetical protein